MSENQPSYYSITPAIVRYDKDLPPNAKLLYGEITALCNKEGYCWAKNRYFAELYSVTITSVSTWISKLADKQYVRIVTEKQDDNSEMRKIYITDPFNIPLIAIKENLNTHLKNFNGVANNNLTPIQENLNPYNTTTNTKNNTTNNKESDEPTIDTNKRKNFVAVREDLYNIQEWRISAMMVKYWDDINWEGIHKDAIPFILDFFRFRRDNKNKPVISGEMANGILNDIRGLDPGQIEKLVYRAKTSGGGWLKLVYKEKESFVDKKKKTFDAINNIK